MKRIALIPVGYNRKDDVINLIDSALKSTIDNYDIVYVDNASSDNSVEGVSSKYGENPKLKIIANEENRGAGSGFNTGLRYAIKEGYDYAMTLDHDLILDPDAVEILFNFLENNQNAAVAFSKFCYMDNPDIIQFGANNYNDKFTFSSPYSNAKDDGTIPEFINSDCFISGAAMFRVELLKEIGLYNEDYFIYEEDEELGLRINSLGYKVVMCSKSRVLHKRAQFQYAKKTTMATYYVRRNMIDVILKFIKEENIEKYCNHLIRELYQLIYSCSYQKKKNTMASALFAVDDALNNCLGKAMEGRILESDIIEDRFEGILKNSRKILIFEEGNFTYKNKCINNLVNRLASYDKTEITRTSSLKDINITDFDVRFKTCEHIFQVDKFDENFIYVDEYLNLVHTEEDRNYCLNYENGLNLFLQYTYPIYINKMRKINAIYKELKIL